MALNPFRAVRLAIVALGPVSRMAPYLTRQLLGCILVIVFASTAHGTSVRAVDMAEMLEQSAVVFEGRVISLQARQDSGTGTIHTYVIFQVLDVLKGEYSKALEYYSNSLVCVP